MNVRIWAMTVVLGSSSLLSAQDRPTLSFAPIDPPSTSNAAAPQTLPSPGVVAAERMTLDQVISTTLLADPKLRSAFEEITQSKGDLWTAGLRPNPTFSPGGQFLPLTHPFTVDRTGGPPELDLGASWQLDWFLFGKRAAAIVAANKQLRATEQDYYDTVRQRIRDAALAFYDILEAQGLAEQARQDLQNLQKVENVTQRAVENGGRAQVELNRIRLDRLRSDQTLREAIGLATTNRSKLRAFLGRSDSDSSFDIIGSLDLPAVKPNLTTDEAFAIAQENRPDILSLRWKIDKAQADTIVEHRKAFPEVTAKLGYSRQFQTRAIGMPDANSYFTGVDVTLPIFDRNQGNRLKASSNLAQSQYDYQAGLVDLRAEIEQVLTELRMAQATAEAAGGEQLKLAGEVLDAITKAYAAGGRPLLDVLDAQRNFRDTYRLYITSRANYWRASVKLSATLGKKL
ncbi:MAG TPA: TolC family protein [Gemmataceae bacterium]|nr:TolC family protein [Gemmataceae bacterium]